MAVRPEVAALADKYRCDRHDPVFGVLEAVLELRDDLVARTSPTHAGTLRADLEKIGEGIDTRTARLKHTLDEFGAETTGRRSLRRKAPKRCLLHARSALAKSSFLA